MSAPKKIEITPQMIQAGLEVLQDSGWLEFESPAQALLVEEILRAALAHETSED